MASRHLIMRKGDLVALDGREARCIAICSGEVWLTQHNDPRDHILGAGQILRLNGTGVTVVRACAPARVELRDPASGARSGPRWRTMLGLLARSTRALGIRSA